MTDSQDDMRKLMCYPKQHTLAKLVHRLRVFPDEVTEWLFDLQLDRFESDDEEIFGYLFSEEELVEVNVSQLDRLAGLDEQYRTVDCMIQC
jgi:hypothetical protein